MMPGTRSRLCIFCRRLEVVDETCPYLALYAHNKGQAATKTAISLSTITPLSVEDEQLLHDLQSRESRLCQRCSDYDVLRVFECANPLDAVLSKKLADYNGHLKNESQYEMALGRLSSLVLDSGCQLCRLKYRIMPRQTLDPEDDMLRLTPFRTYIRENGWESIPDEARSEYAVFLALRKPEVTVTVGSFGKDMFQFANMQLEVIALDSRYTFPGRKWTNSRFIGSMVDMSLIRQALNHCLKNHPAFCQVKPAQGLEVISLIDVCDRKVVPYRPNYDYAALSYVWGGAMPVPGALEARKLPQTLEDAITVTKEIGLQYVWIDALCIDQTPNPTPEQAAAKAKQLGMMNLIYASAAITIVALAGSDANAGLPGISRACRRTKQFQEAIDGKVLFTVPPSFAAERDQSTWNTRAWTYQESFLSKRYVYFSSNQAYFTCLTYGPSESTDMSSNPPGDYKHRGITIMDELLDVTSDKVLTDDSRSFSALFASLLYNYTNRRLTNEQDSINAFLGLLAAMQRKLFPTGFVWGLPLKSHPELLGWFHDRAKTPKRRLMFPSWSWAGWEGTALFHDRLVGSSGGDDKLTTNDMQPEFVSCQGHKLVVNAWLVKIKAVTEPFTEVLVPGTTEAYGSITERNCLHNDTIPTGEYSCLIVQRSQFRLGEDRPLRQRIYLLVLEVEDNEASRRTMITLSPWDSSDFMLLKPERKIITLL